MLYEILLKYGIDLTTPIEEKEINNKKVYIVGFGKLIIYFDEIDTQIAKEIVELDKEYENDFSVLVLKDDSFATSQDKVNIVEFFKQMNLFEKIITLKPTTAFEYIICKVYNANATIIMVSIIL